MTKKNNPKHSEEVTSQKIHNGVMKGIGKAVGIKTTPQKQTPKLKNLDEFSTYIKQGH